MKIYMKPDGSDIVVIELDNPEAKALQSLCHSVTDEKNGAVPIAKKHSKRRKVAEYIQLHIPTI